MENGDDQLIKRMAKLLREGATMLDKSCPECGTLIYRLPDNRIICPSCNREIIIQKDSTVQKETSNHSQIRSNGSHTVQPILDTLNFKLIELSSILRKELDFKKIEKILILLELIIRLYKNIQDLD